MDTPYEYYDGKLGVKISYLISDRNASPKSLKYLAYRSLKYRLDSKTCSEQTLRRSSLGCDALILHSSLCRDWKDALTLNFGSPNTEIKKSWFSQHYEADQKARDFYEGYRLGEDGRKLDRALVDRYICNASVLNTVIKLKANRKAYAKALGVTKLDIWESLSRDVNAFKEVDHNLPTTSRGLRLQVDKYQEEGYEGIISRKLQNHNAAKVKDDQQMALLDELIYKHNNLDNAQVSNIYNTVAGAMNWKVITAQTVGNRKEEKGLIAYAGRNGKSALLDNKLMQNKRQAASAPMLYWTMDGWDAELLYQSTTINKAGHRVTTYHNRLTVVVVLDAYNKYPIGYAIGTHETPELIKAALRNAMQHVRELFGGLYRPYQLQTDNYGRGALKPVYEASSKHYTPAKVKNAKAKIIEPWFNRFNKEYCQLFANWSGHNVDSGSLNQPNSEMLNQLRHTFPDEAGCRKQLVVSLEAERDKKRDEFVSNWQLDSERYSLMPHETYLNYLGMTTGYTNRLQPDGLNPKIEGVERWYESYDLNFRKQAHLDWIVKYDPADLKQVLVVNGIRTGKEIKEIGDYRFMLDEVHVNSMALADRTEGDAAALQRVKDFNNDAMAYISNERGQNADILDEFFKNPLLNDTLAKHVLVDSLGQHKNRRNEPRIGKKAAELAEAAHVEDTQQQQQGWHQQQKSYYESKISLDDYL
jgi:hypothetical protein